MSTKDKTVYGGGTTIPEDSGATVPETDGSTIFEGTIADAAIAEAAEHPGEVLSNDAIEKDCVLLDTYRVDSSAIHGGMGSVWRVHHQNWNVNLAMKRPQEKLFANETQKANFIRECEAWIDLGLHPNIVSCYYVRELGGVPTIFSEWMENGSLENRIQDGSVYNGTEEEVQKRLLDIAIQFARGLHYAHETGLIHQDVKPDNLLLSKGWDAKVADFGLARARAQLTVLDGSATVLDADPGATAMVPSGGYTPAYCSMEQMDGKPLTRRTDIYSWAVSVMELYLGSRPWTNGVVAGLSCREYFENCRIPMPERLKKLLARCMAAEPEERPHDFGEVEAELRNVYQIEMGEAYPIPMPKAAADTADSLNNRALSLLDLGKSDAAEKLFRMALRKNTHDVRVICNSTIALWNAGKLTDEAVIDSLVKEYQRTKNELIKQALLDFFAATDNALLYRQPVSALREIQEEDAFSEVDGTGLISLEETPWFSPKILSAAFLSRDSVLVGGKHFLWVLSIGKDGISSSPEKQIGSQENIGGFSGISADICTFSRIVRDTDKRHLYCFGNSESVGYFKLTLRLADLGAISMEKSNYDECWEKEVSFADRYETQLAPARVRFIGKTSGRCLRSIPGDYCTDLWEEDGRAIVVQKYGAAVIEKISNDHSIRTCFLSRAESTETLLENEKRADKLTESIRILIRERKYEEASEKLDLLREIPGYEMTAELREEEAVLSQNCFADLLKYAVSTESMDEPMAEPFAWKRAADNKLNKILKKQIMGKKRDVKYTPWDWAEHVCVGIKSEYIDVFGVGMVSANVTYKKTGRHGGQENSPYISVTEIYRVDGKTAYCVAHIDRDTRKWQQQAVFSRDGSKKTIWNISRGELVFSETVESQDAFQITVPFEGELLDGVFSSDNRFFAAAIEDKQSGRHYILLQNTDVPDNMLQVTVIDLDWEPELRFSQDGRYLFFRKNGCFRIGYSYDASKPPMNATETRLGEEAHAVQKHSWFWRKR